MRKVSYVCCALFLFAAFRTEAKYLSASADTVCAGDLVTFDWYDPDADSTFFVGPEKVSGNIKTGKRGSITVPVHISYRYKIAVYKNGVCTKMTVLVVAIKCGIHPTRIEETEESPKVLVYPNPFRDVITIEHSGRYCFRITNTMGQDVISVRCSEGRTAVSLRDLVPGPYLLFIDKRPIRILKE